MGPFQLIQQEAAKHDCETALRSVTVVPHGFVVVYDSWIKSLPETRQSRMAFVNADQFHNCQRVSTDALAQ